MKNILVTGGAGFIGSNLVNTLSSDCNITVIDNLSHGKKSNIVRRHKFIKLDIRSHQLKDIIKSEKPDTIYHFAAQSSISKSINDPSSDLTINLLGTQNIINCAKKTSVKKLIFSSSAAVYSQNLKTLIKEGDEKLPITTYGLSKLCSEMLLSQVKKENGLTFISLRFSNVYGPNQDSEGESGVIAIFIKNLIKGQALQIYSDGKQTRDFIYVSDVVNACITSGKIKTSDCFNISTGTGTSIISLAKKLLLLNVSKNEVKYENLKYREVRNSILSYSKFNVATGWKPKVNLESGLRKTFDFFGN